MKRLRRYLYRPRYSWLDVLLVIAILWLAFRS